MPVVSAIMQQLAALCSDCTVPRDVTLRVGVHIINSRPFLYALRGTVAAISGLAAVVHIDAEVSRVEVVVVVVTISDQSDVAHLLECSERASVHRAARNFLASHTSDTPIVKSVQHLV